MKKGSNEVKKALPLIGIISLFAIVGGALGGHFANQSVRDDIHATAVVTPYESFKYDYKVSGLSNEQFEDFKTNKYVDEIAPYYVFQYKFEFKGNEFQLDTLTTNNQANLTEWVDERIVDKVEDVDNGIYLDTYTSTKYKIGVGDTLMFGKNEFVVTRLYQAYDSNIAYFPSLFNKVSKNMDKYAGVYLKTNNKEQFHHDKLAHYIPMGELREKLDSQTQEEYDDYYDEFMAKDYKTRIKDRLVDKAQDENRSLDLLAAAKTNMIVSLVVPSVAMLIGALLIYLIPIKKLNYEIQILGNKANAQKRYLVANAIGLVLYILTTIITLVIAHPLSAYYLTLGSLIGKGMLYALLPIGVIIIMELIIFCIIKGTKIKKK